MARKRTFPSYLVYQDEQSRWRWTYAGPAGKEIAVGCASYGSREGCVGAIRGLQQSATHPVFAIDPATPASGAKASSGDAGVLDLDPPARSG